jgi:hypothetical protein
VFGQLLDAGKKETQNKRSVTAEGPVRSQVSPCEFYREQSSIWTGWSPSSPVSPVSVIPPTLHTLLLYMLLGEHWIEKNRHCFNGTV